MNRSTQAPPSQTPDHSTGTDTAGIPAGPPLLAKLPSSPERGSTTNGHVAVIRPRRRHSAATQPTGISVAHQRVHRPAKADRLQTYVDWLNAVPLPDNAPTTDRPPTARRADPSMTAAEVTDTRTSRFTSIGAGKPAAKRLFLSADLDHPWTGKPTADPSTPTPKRPELPHEDVSDFAPPSAPDLPPGPQLDLYRFDRPSPQRETVPRSHVNFHVESAATTPPIDSAYQDSNRDFVASISSAIAAALSDAPSADAQTRAEVCLTKEEHVPHQQGLDDQAEELIEDMIKIRLDQAQRASNDAIPEDILVAELLKQRLSDQHSTSQANHPSQTPSEVIDSATKKPSRDGHQSDQEQRQIPLKLAAWDVEDFRWPVVSNQMIVSGGHALDELLTQTLHQVSTRPRRIAISGAGRVLGSTSIAISLARWSAAKGLKTLLIDADVASPELSTRVGMASNMSWLNGVNKDLPVAELVIRSRANDLCVMPLASTVTRVTWPRFIFDNLGELLDPIKQDFDLILIDTGPASQVLDELSSPDRLIDGMLLLQDSQSRKVETIQNRLVTFGIENFVMVSNRQTLATPNVA